MHWPVRLKKGSASFDPENLVQPDIPCTWRAMETLYDSGKARAIGVSNFSTKKLSDLLDVARIPPAAVQVECHPSWQQGKLHSFCKSKGVHLQVSMQILNDIFNAKFLISLTFLEGVTYIIGQEFNLRSRQVSSKVEVTAYFSFRDTHHWVLRAHHGSRVTSFRIQFFSWSQKN